MSDYYTGNKDDKLSFQQIALGHYKRILEISTSEFVGGYYNYVYSGNSTTKQYITDKRTEFTQAVETFALSLYPHFDEQMKKSYAYYLKESQKLYKKYADADGFIRASGDARLKHSVEMLELVKRLFRNLSSLMFRLDYFKTAQYSEGDYEPDIMDIDGREITKTNEEKEDEKF